MGNRKDTRLMSNDKLGEWMLNYRILHKKKERNARMRQYIAMAIATALFIVEMFGNARLSAVGSNFCWLAITWAWWEATAVNFHAGALKGFFETLKTFSEIEPKE